jgi:hypothetical protein
VNPQLDPHATGVDQDAQVGEKLRLFKRTHRDWQAWVLPFFGNE